MLRAATAADASRLAEIYIFAKRMAYRPIFNDDLVSFNEMQVLPLALDLRDRDEARKGLFVWDDGIVRGLARRSWLPGEEKTFFFEELYVDPCFQGQGYGGKLMNSFLDAARSEGAREVFLWVLEKNGRAQGMYKRFGFAPDGSRELEEGTPEYKVGYRLKL